jgi:hypothetical protein
MVPPDAAREIGGDALSLVLDLTDAIDEGILFEHIADERKGPP